MIKQKKQVDFRPLPARPQPEAQAVALGLGSNLGNRAAYIARAVECLGNDILSSICLSPLIETEPLDCRPGTPLYLNAALCGWCVLSPERLLQACRQVEAELGRPNDHPYHANRTIDLDLLLFGEQIVNLPQLRIPHPALLQRDFVLQPLAAIAPHWQIPGTGGTVKDALQCLAEEKKTDF